MKKIFAIMALIVTSIPAVAVASPLEAEDAVAYLLAGIQVSKTTNVAGTDLLWTQNASGRFVGIGSHADGPVHMIMSVRKLTDCTYETSGNVTVAGEVVASVAPAVYDFTKIIGIDLLRPNLAGVDAAKGFCTSNEPSMCGSFIDLAVPTDAATYKQVYQDFRSDHCP
ncbi:MAG: hypothetical protein JWP26_992 [Devosia sp.]|uniref:hypothetical protein n=1 Tax=Devosia sp. TaxID=1871048 RepID=UPI0026276A8B|nr:hypothetical protein [Devosia sp.]MDB5586022.1 hypothetical protein [Devosia sp.]